MMILLNQAREAYRKNTDKKVKIALGFYFSGNENQPGSYQGYGITTEAIIDHMTALDGGLLVNEGNITYFINYDKVVKVVVSAYKIG